MTHYLNNCENRDHQALFGQDAFFDLDTGGYQAEMYLAFQLGDSCIVASQPEPGVVTFSWFIYRGSRLAIDKDGVNVRALTGSFVKEEALRKADAAAHGSYQRFFDKNGNFKRRSILRD